MPNLPKKHRPPGYKSQEQRKADYDKTRGTAHQRGYNSRWRKRREGYLKENPLCVVCLKEYRPVPANIVDHVIPHKGNQTLFWDETNWQSLCKTHHDIKTAKEDGGFGR